MMQILVQSLYGNTIALSFSADAIAFGDVKCAIEAREGIPIHEQKLTCNGKVYDDSFRISSETAQTLPPLRLGLRVVGGKGGFGSLLRGGNTRVGQKKVTAPFALHSPPPKKLQHVQTCN